ncbi:hypothetical protein [Inhella sp.]|uniref:hypothetical protein n=1 Tax=Inhella sp. TaxID=1921806 RepID=UPI0035B079D1
MLKHIRLRYDPIADRLLLDLQMATPQGGLESHLLHLTRRIVHRWRGELQAMVDMSAELPQRMDPAARAAISQAHHQAMSAQVNARTEPAPPAEAEVQGEPPRLVTRIGCGRHKLDGRWVLQFECQTGAPLTLVLGTKTLHGLVDALSRRVQSAQWGLPAVATERQAVSAPPPTGGALH